MAVRRVGEHFYVQLTHREQVELLAKYRAGDTEARNELVNAMSRFAVVCAAKFRCDNRRFPTDDRIQVAMLGVMRAIESWEPERGMLTTYVAKAIWSRLLRHIQGDGFIRIPIHRAGGEGLPRVTFPMAHTGTERKSKSDVRADWAVSKSDGSDARLAEQDDRQIVQDALAELPLQYRTIVLRIADGETQTEIAEDLGIRRQAVSQMYGRAVAVLRKDERLRSLVAA